MKKLFGVMMLAGLPIACGTNLPSTPGDLATPDGGQGTVKSSSVPSDVANPCAQTADILGLDLTVVEFGRGWVTVRADGIFSPGAPDVCFIPTWALATARRSVSLVPGTDPQVMTLYAKPGKYEMVARYEIAADKFVEGRLAVEVF